MTIPTNLGPGQLRAAWDSNLNGIIDPTDKWGEYSDGGGSSLNPMMLADSDINADVYIPLGSGFSILPFVLISGTLQMVEGFDGQPVLYLAALKRKPSLELYTSELQQGYQMKTWNNPTGTEISFSMIVPANTVTWISAYADSDNDGTLQEVGEPAGYYQGGAALSTGYSSVTNMEIDLHPVPEL
jgi:hypothetical protein